MPPKRHNTLGLSQSEIKTYLALLKHSPANGSQISRHAGIPRANIYDILGSLINKGMATNLNGGVYVPLPPDEFLKRLRLRVDSDIASLEKQIEAISRNQHMEYIWTIRGYDEVMAKAVDMIADAQRELYVLLYPDEAAYLDSHLLEAQRRGVEVKYVSMGKPATPFELQVIHPDADRVETSHRGRVFDVVRDKIEILVGVFEHAREEDSSINWAKNHWFVAAIREGIRHDFFHYFVHKMIDRGESLSAREKKMYQRIKRDVWGDESYG